jgi:hypothetical protein
MRLSVMLMMASLAISSYAQTENKAQVFSGQAVTSQLMARSCKRPKARAVVEPHLAITNRMQSSFPYEPRAVALKCTRSMTIFLLLLRERRT